MILHNVYARHPAWVLPIAIPFILVFGFLYYILFGDHFKLSFIMIFTLLYLGAVAFIIKKSSEDVMIWFNDEHMFIQKGNKKQQKYLKENISGFYSYDYETKTPLLKKSLIKIKFICKDGSKIHLNDSEYRNRYDEEKGKILEKMIQTAQLELGFKKIKSTKWSGIQNHNFYEFNTNNSPYNISPQSVNYKFYRSFQLQ